ncbi:unnamed protein product [Moneuplotes crassus]|uniref:snRNA-activating protein complex subunit 3 n=1 Tax=Euplotes crassus TaxID=5936 RepID=A0AAD1U8F8_EUPCR|nr:unnamed protein product [Moneuplotes crassus]
MSFSHKENTLYINGQVLKETFSTQLKKFNNIINSKEESIVTGIKAEKLEALTNLSDIYVPSTEEQIEMYCDDAFDALKQHQVQGSSGGKSTLRPEAQLIENIMGKMKSRILNQEELSKLASYNSFKLLAELEDKRLKFDKNYIYNKFDDPNPDYGSFSKWRSLLHISKKSAIEDEIIYKIVIYHPTKHTRMMAFNMVGTQTLQDIQSKIYCPCDYVFDGKQSYDPIQSFFFIEGCFHYNYKPTMSHMESVLQTEIDLLIATHNDLLSKNLIHTNSLILPDSSLSHQILMQNKEGDESDGISLDSDDLEPRTESKSLNQNKNSQRSRKEENKVHFQEEEKEPTKKEEKEKILEVKQLDFTQKNPKHYSTRKPSQNENMLSSFPNCPHRYSKKDMSATKLDDLEIKIGIPYIYKHNDHCSHYISFTEIRKYEKLFDDPDINNYPLLVFQESIKRKICEICEDIRAKLIVCVHEIENFNPPLFSTEQKADKPIFICENCYQDVFLDQEGNRIYSNMTVAQYFHE